MQPLIVTLFELLYIILDLFKWVLLIGIVISWLIAFNVINTRNRFVYMVMDFFERVTEPVLRPIRNVMPNLGGIDISPIIALLGVWFLQSLIVRYGMMM
ncbi:YggT family protein [Azospirillum sp.]|uniref:YggT family protein n=1 Tax=Azospirillum sp. TaxID=34012 RepID=UPI002D73FD65|nr:YggT family protein [Azospirillum sp.]HYD66674.1 YggT family protein [Azospirillum sp.]